MSLQRLVWAGIVAFALVGLVGMLTATAATGHCPDHNGHPGKVEGNYNGLVIAEGTVFCVKAGPDAGGTQTADGVTPLIGYVSWTVGQGNTPDVSYYVVYSVPGDDPPVEPTPEPTVPPTDPPVVPEYLTICEDGITVTKLEGTFNHPWTHGPCPVADEPVAEPPAVLVASLCVDGDVVKYTYHDLLLVDTEIDAGACAVPELVIEPSQPVAVPVPAQAGNCGPDCR